MGRASTSSDIELFADKAGMDAPAETMYSDGDYQVTLRLVPCGESDRADWNIEFSSQCRALHPGLPRSCGGSRFIGATREHQRQLVEELQLFVRSAYQVTDRKISEPSLVAL